MRIETKIFPSGFDKYIGTLEKWTDFNINKNCMKDFRNECAKQSL